MSFPFDTRTGEDPNLRLAKEVRENKYSPAILVRLILLRFIREWFFGRNKGDYRYCVDDSISDIIISESNVVNNDVVAKKPVIIMSRGPVVPLNLFINGGRVYERPFDGAEKSVDLLMTQINFNCISREVLESEIIASYIFGILRYHLKDICSLGMHSIKSVVLNPPSPAGDFLTPGSTSKIEAWNHPVGCTAFIVDRWDRIPKVEEDLKKWEDRTGIDPRGLNIPQNRLEQLELWPRVINHEGETVG